MWGGVTGIMIGFNASADFPYIRWIVGSNVYQLQVQNAGLTYMKRIGSGQWETIWTAH